jgi:hypothetical protein
MAAARAPPWVTQRRAGWWGLVVSPLTVLVHGGEVLRCRSGVPHPRSGLDHAREGERVLRRHQEQEVDRHRYTMTLPLGLLFGLAPLVMAQSTP